MKIVREHINFRKPESEENFKDNLFPRIIRIIKRAPVLGYGYHIAFKDEIEKYFVSYDKDTDEFYRNMEGNSIVIEKLKQYNIPYKISNVKYMGQTYKFSFSGRYVDWEDGKHKAFKIVLTEAEQIDLKKREAQEMLDLAKGKLLELKAMEIPKADKAKVDTMIKRMKLTV